MPRPGDFVSLSAVLTEVQGGLQGLWDLTEVQTLFSRLGEGPDNLFISVLFLQEHLTCDSPSVMVSTN